MGILLECVQGDLSAGKTERFLEVTGALPHVARPPRGSAVLVRSPAGVFDLRMRSLVLLVVLISRNADGFVSTMLARTRLPSAITAQKLPVCAFPVAAGRKAIDDGQSAPRVRMKEDDDKAIMKESPLRSVVKAAGWRFTAGVVTATTSFIFTGAFVSRRFR